MVKPKTLYNAINQCYRSKLKKEEKRLSGRRRPTHFDLQARLEADAIGDGRLEFGDGVILFLHLGWDGRLGQVETSRLERLNTVLSPTEVHSHGTKRVRGETGVYNHPQGGADGPMGQNKKDLSCRHLLGGSLALQL